MARNDTDPVHATDRVTRRSVLTAAGTALAGATLGVGSASAQSAPEFGGWLEKTENYTGIVDRTGSSTVTVSVGPSDVAGGPYAYGPAVVRVDPGTTIAWKWTGNGGSHNVVATDGRFESDLMKAAGATFEHTFEDSGAYKYYCTPHKALGMRGVVVVGDVTFDTGSGGLSLPGSDAQKLVMLMLTGIASVSAGIALLPDVPAALEWAGRQVGQVGYGVHRQSDFRNRPVSSTAIGWLTFTVILLCIGVILLGLWTLGRGPIGFFIGLLIVALVVAGYLIAATDVSPMSDFNQRSRRTAAAGGGRAHTMGTFGGFAPGIRRVTVTRIGKFVRGGLGVTLLLAVGAVGVAAVGFLFGSGSSFLIALFAVAVVIAAYAVTTTW